mmetsp:Transcript_5061/g.16704  ORF Transcript_5061/g.16704 Transcript_5061/m.16704 type:complete len:266 (+) Transcript_5061:408-1205(+)
MECVRLSIIPLINLHTLSLRCAATRPPPATLDDPTPPRVRHRRVIARTTLPHTPPRVFHAQELPESARTDPSTRRPRSYARRRANTPTTIASTDTLENPHSPRLKTHPPPTRISSRVPRSRARACRASRESSVSSLANRCSPTHRACTRDTRRVWRRDRGTHRTASTRTPRVCARTWRVSSSRVASRSDDGARRDRGTPATAAPHSTTLRAASHHADHDPESVRLRHRIHRIDVRSERVRRVQGARCASRRRVNILGLSSNCFED